MTDARAAAALLRYGDKRARAKAFTRIKPALARKDTAAIAIPALGALREQRRRRDGRGGLLRARRAARRRCAKASPRRASSR